MKVGRWVRDTLFNSNDADHWIDTIIANTTRLPCHHLFVWLQKESSKVHDLRQTCVRGNVSAADASTSDAIEARSSWSTLQHLVYYKSTEFENDYAKLFAQESLLDASMWGRLRDHIPGSSFDGSDRSIGKLMEKCVLFALEGACDYHKRIACFLQGISCQIAWVVYAPAEARCHHRMKIAQLLVDHGNGKKTVERMEKGSWVSKLAHVFYSCWEHAASTGLLHKDVHAMVFVFCSKDSSHTLVLSAYKQVQAMLIEMSPMSNALLKKKYMYGARFIRNT